MKDNATVAPAIFEGEKNEINILNHKEYNIKCENENYILDNSILYSVVIKPIKWIHKRCDGRFFKNYFYLMYHTYEMFRFPRTLDLT